MLAFTWVHLGFLASAAILIKGDLVPAAAIADRSRR
jgi:hypothetical protein